MRSAMTRSTLLLAAALLATAAQAAEPARGQVVNVWVRPSGSAARRPVAVDLSAHAKTEVTREDVHYGGAKAKYRGVPLRALLDVIPQKGKSDLALLHFLNGMVVPLPIDDLELLKALDPFVATELEQAGAWSTAFPEVRKAGAGDRDHRPLVFQGNKLVLSTRQHPYVSAPAAADGFTPFFFADTLTGVEFVQAAAWYKQFDVGRTEEEKQGFALFKSHCQYCHGVREAGARYGIDFMKPRPVAERRDVQSLFLHLRYRDRDAPETGQMMPFFRHLAKPEVAALHAWLKLLTKTRPVPYVEPASRLKPPAAAP